MADEKEGKVIHVAFGGVREVEKEVEPASDLSIQKFGVFSDLIENGVVMVTLDTRADGVQIPAQFDGMPQLHLNFCYDYQIPDFDFDDHGIRASLSFGGQNYFCDIPWDAVYMMRPEEDLEGMVFPASLPEEIRAMLPPEVLKMMEDPSTDLT